jgi:tetratricopeptide (TPR) repeat protein
MGTLIVDCRRAARRYAAVALPLMLCCPLKEATAQPGERVDLPKPEKYQNRVLASEKSTTGGFGPLKRVSQNIGTRYNFVFNAGRELDEVVASTRQSKKDDFTRRLSFYEVDPASTASQRSELDSVILKCNNGILLHDLRNDWTDDLYLLMGKAYYYRNDPDSALIAFQYINQAFQPREKDEIGFEKSVGSRFNRNGNSFTVATPEKKGPASLVSHKPARNEALIWLVRSLIVRGDMDEARGLLETLRRDRNMPPRLRSGLSEMEALWYYSSGMPDSAAVHLEKALEGATDNRERARWEYLNAQLYQTAGQTDKAARLYESVIRLTTDPVMEAYARIQRIGLYGDVGDSVQVTKAFRELLQMAEKAKYEEYRHLVYHAAARIQRDLGNPRESVKYMKASLAANRTDPAHRSLLFLELGDAAYGLRDYRLARDSYDSVTLDGLQPGRRSEVEYRRQILSDIVHHMDNVAMEDSLQRIAAMPEARREEYLQAMIRKWRREQGIKEETGAGASSNQSSPLARDAQPVDIFASNESKGEWYFYNAGLKAQGFRQFQSKWGKRPNLDNWRRIAAVNSQMNANNASAGMALDSPDRAAGGGAGGQPRVQEMTMESLLAGLPLAEERRKASNDSIQSSLFALGRIFHDRLDDCTETVRHLESLVDRYPKTPRLEESLFMLARCHGRIGNAARSESYRAHLEREFPGSRSVRYLRDPEGEARKERQSGEEATRAYEDVYTKISEGRFEEARALKEGIEATRGENPWSPQLLYIDAMLNAREGRDSMAIDALDRLAKLYPESEVAAKGKGLKDALMRRSEIEARLNGLQVSRDTSERWGKPVDETARSQAKPPQVRAPQVVAEPPKTAEPPKETAKAVDPTPTQPPQTVTSPKGYTFDPAEPHAVAVILEKADIAYIAEARYSLNRYNGRTFPSEGLEVSKVNVNKDLDVVLVKGFQNASKAMEYIENVRPEAQKSILSWMPSTMYLFAPVTEANLEILIRDQDLPAYLRFIRGQLPGKF